MVIVLNLKTTAFKTSSHTWKSLIWLDYRSKRRRLCLPLKRFGAGFETYWPHP
jgi:hypothetical protein